MPNRRSPRPSNEAHGVQFCHKCMIAHQSIKCPKCGAVSPQMLDFCNGCERSCSETRCILSMFAFGKESEERTELATVN